MTDRAARALTFLSAAVSSLILGVFTVYVLWNFKTTAGLFVATGALSVALGIAFRTQFHLGVAAVKDNAAELLPVLIDAVRRLGKKDDASGGDGA